MLSRDRNLSLAWPNWIDAANGLRTSVSGQGHLLILMMVYVAVRAHPIVVRKILPVVHHPARMLSIKLTAIALMIKRLTRPLQRSNSPYAKPSALATAQEYPTTSTHQNVCLETTRVAVPTCKNQLEATLSFIRKLFAPGKPRRKQRTPSNVLIGQFVISKRTRNVIHAVGAMVVVQSARKTNRQCAPTKTATREWTIVVQIKIPKIAVRMGGTNLVSYKSVKTIWNVHWMLTARPTVSAMGIGRNFVVGIKMELAGNVRANVVQVDVKAILHVHRMLTARSMVSAIRIGRNFAVAIVMELTGNVRANVIQLTTM